MDKDLARMSEFVCGMKLASEGIGRGCESCGTDNPWNRRFCRACGAKIVVACGGCDFGNAIADLYCGGCGADLSSFSLVANQQQTQSPPVAAGKPPKPPPLDPGARALARKLSDLNSSNVTHAGKPPPIPKKSGDATADDLGQDQIDALFG